MDTKTIINKKMQTLETRSLGSFESLTLDAAILKVKEAGYKVIREL